MTPTARSLAVALLLAALPACGADEGDPSTPGERPFTITALTEARISSQSDEPNFHRVEAEVDLGEGSFSSVVLRVQLTSTCYPFEKWGQDRPPSGQNWPASCDAFDRNFELSFDDPTAEGEPPGIELVRAITPFGGPLSFEQDLTDLANARPGKHRLRARIPSYSDAEGKVSGSNGGWNVSAQLEVTPGPAPRQVLAAIPLVYQDQTEAELPSVSFELPEGTTSARLEYRVTGHGGVTAVGCSGPAEEFCKRTHTVDADGVELSEYQPWRTDCADLCTEATQPAIPGLLREFTYCLENPCGAIPSVRASRANWCPGSVTPPFIEQPAAWASAGAHRFQSRVNAIASGGLWRVSALVYAFGD